MTLSGGLVVLGALTAAGIAWSSGVLSGGPAEIRVYGGGQIAAISRTISLEANANPAGLGLASLPALASVGPGGPPTASCPGSSANPEAAPGTLCFYIALKGNVVTTPPYTLGPGMTAEDVTTGTDGKTDTFGALLYANVAAAGRGFIEGSWAVTAP